MCAQPLLCHRVNPASRNLQIAARKEAERLEQIRLAEEKRKAEELEKARWDVFTEREAVESEHTCVSIIIISRGTRVEE